MNMNKIKRKGDERKDMFMNATERSADMPEIITFFVVSGVCLLIGIGAFLEAAGYIFKKDKKDEE